MSDNQSSSNSDVVGTEESVVQTDSSNVSQPRQSQRQQQSHQQQPHKAQTHKSQQHAPQTNYHQAPPSRVSQQRLAKQKSHVAGRLHNRVPSSKGTHAGKHHGHTNSNATAAVRPPNRRTQSDQRLPTAGPSNGPIGVLPSAAANNAASKASSAALKRTSSQTAIARNRSSTEIAVGRRHASSKASIAGDRPKRTSSGANINNATQTRSRAHKQPARFDVGFADQDDDDDEWQDASTSASPYIAKHAPPSNQPVSNRDTQPSPTENRASRMTAPASAVSTLVSQPEPPGIYNAAGDSLSRTVARTNTATSNDGSSYTQSTVAGSNSTSLGHGIRPDSLSNGLRQRNDSVSEDEDESAIVHGRIKPKPADMSRTQQKLDLQRASSVMDAAALPTAHTNMSLMGGAPRLVAVSMPNNDGTATRDPRVVKTLDLTGSEYLVVRRFTNPLARCAQRLSKTSPIMKKIPNSTIHQNHTFTSPSAGLSSLVSDLSAERSGGRHSRRVSTASRTGTYRSQTDGITEEHGAIPIGSSLVEDDEVTALLQRMWSQDLNLAASQ